MLAVRCCPLHASLSCFLQFQQQRLECNKYWIYSLGKRAGHAILEAIGGILRAQQSRRRIIY